MRQKARAKLRGSVRFGVWSTQSHEVWLNRTLVKGELVISNLAIVRSMC